MSAASCRALLAAKVATLPSVRHVYAADETATVSGWPSETLDDGPHALVGRGPSNRTLGHGAQRVERGIDVTFLFSALEMAEAQRAIDAIEEEIIVAFSSGVTFDGAVIDCVYNGSDRPFADEDSEGRPWYTWIAHFTVRERYALDMTA